MLSGDSLTFWWWAVKALEPVDDIRSIWGRESFLSAIQPPAYFLPLWVLETEAWIMTICYVSMFSCVGGMPEPGSVSAVLTITPAAFRVKAPSVTSEGLSLQAHYSRQLSKCSVLSTKECALTTPCGVKGVLCYCFTSFLTLAAETVWLSLCDRLTDTLVTR